MVELLSPSTAALYQKTKLREYQALPGVREIVLVDHRVERIRLVERIGAEGWRDDWLPYAPRWNCLRRPSPSPTRRSSPGH